MQYLSKKLYSFTTNMLKAYLSTQTSSLSAFMTSKTHIVAQKPHGLQLNAKECNGSKSAILLSLFRLLCSTMITRKWFKYSP